MSSITIFLCFEQHKEEVTVNTNDSFRSVMTKAFNIFNISNSDRDYSQNTYLFKFQGTLLNSDDSKLNRTLKDENIRVDDTLDLIRSKTIDQGR